MNEPNPLSDLSQAIEAQVAAAQGLAVAVRNASHRHVSATLWQPDVVVTSEQAIGNRDEYEVVTAEGTTRKPRIVGRDRGTNLLVLHLDTALPHSKVSAGNASTGALVLALGATVDGATTARSGIVHSVGAQW